MQFVCTRDYIFLVVVVVVVVVFPWTLLIAWNTSICIIYANNWLLWNSYCYLKQYHFLKKKIDFGIK